MDLFFLLSCIHLYCTSLGQLPHICTRLRLDSGDDYLVHYAGILTYFIVLICISMCISIKLQHVSNAISVYILYLCTADLYVSVCLLDSWLVQLKITMITTCHGTDIHVLYQTLNNCDATLSDKPF